MHAFARFQTHYLFADILNPHCSHACDSHACVPSAEEEYLQDSVNPVAYYVGPEMQALQTASSAVSRMVKDEVCSPFCTTGQHEFDLNSSHVTAALVPCRLLLVSTVLLVALHCAVQAMSLSIVCGTIRMPFA